MDEIEREDGRHEIVASLIRDAIEKATDEAADDAANRVMAYLLVEPRGCPTPGACSAALTPAPAVWSDREGCVGTMTADRATFFLERFKRDEKMLGPHEQWALDYAIAALSPPPPEPR